jgi:hypothetical protein
VFHPVRRSGSRTVIRRTAKQLTIFEVDGDGVVWRRSPFTRDSDLWSFEEDFRWAMKPQRDETPPPPPQLEFDFVKSLVQGF